jgi:DNA-directed RNA polymerase specialized sigma24 family protein
VADALRKMSDRQRAALVLKYLCDQPTASVAGSLNLSYSAPESLLARARTSFSSHYVAC